MQQFGVIDNEFVPKKDKIVKQVKFELDEKFSKANVTPQSQVMHTFIDPMMKNVSTEEIMYKRGLPFPIGQSYGYGFRPDLGFQGGAYSYDHPSNPEREMNIHHVFSGVSFVASIRPGFESCIPGYMTSRPEGLFELFCASTLPLAPFESASLITGLNIRVPDGYLAKVCINDEVGAMKLVCSSGLFDSGYAGELDFNLINCSDETQVIYTGSKVGKLILLPNLSYGRIAATWVSDSRFNEKKMKK